MDSAALRSTEPSDPDHQGEEKKMKVILASASPRRQELLKDIIPDFEILVANVDEEALVDSDPVETAKKTARAKAEAVANLRPNALIIAGDTVVDIDGEQLAKPQDKEDAFRMLRRLSGRTHRVVTGMCLILPSPMPGESRGGEDGMEVSSDIISQTVQFQVQTQVTFRELTDEEIWAYIATGEPMDKAGAYGAQGEAAKHIARIEGSLTNVIGLPVDELKRVFESIRHSV